MDESIMVDYSKLSDEELLNLASGKKKPKIDYKSMSDEQLAKMTGMPIDIDTSVQEPSQVSIPTGNIDYSNLDSIHNGQTIPQPSLLDSAVEYAKKNVKPVVKNISNAVNDLGNNLYNGISQIGNITYNPQQNLITGGGVTMNQPAPELPKTVQPDLKVDNQTLNSLKTDLFSAPEKVTWGGAVKQMLPAGAKGLSQSGYYGLAGGADIAAENTAKTLEKLDKPIPQLLLESLNPFKNPLDSSADVALAAKLTGKENKLKKQLGKDYSTLKEFKKWAMEKPNRDYEKWVNPAYKYTSPKDLLSPKVLPILSNLTTQQAPVIASALLTSGASLPVQMAAMGATSAIPSSDFVGLADEVAQKTGVSPVLSEREQQIEGLLNAIKNKQGSPYVSDQDDLSFLQQQLNKAQNYDGINAGKIGAINDLVAGTSGLLDAIPLVRGMKRTGVSNALNKTLLNIAKDAKAGKTVRPNAALNYAKSVVPEAAEEFATGGAQEGLSIAGEKAAGVNDEGLIENLKRIGNSATLEAAGSIVPASAFHVIGAKNRQQAYKEEGNQRDLINKLQNYNFAQGEAKQNIENIAPKTAAKQAESVESTVKENLTAETTDNNTFTSYKEAFKELKKQGKGYTIIHNPDNTYTVGLAGNVVKNVEKTPPENVEESVKTPLENAENQIADSSKMVEETKQGEVENNYETNTIYTKLPNDNIVAAEKRGKDWYIADNKITDKKLVKQFEKELDTTNKNIEKDYNRILEEASSEEGLWDSGNRSETEQKILKDLLGKGVLTREKGQEGVHDTANGVAKWVYKVKQNAEAQAELIKIQKNIPSSLQDILNPEALVSEENHKFGYATQEGDTNIIPDSEQISTPQEETAQVAEQPTEQVKTKEVGAKKTSTAKKKIEKLAPKTAEKQAKKQAEKTNTEDKAYYNTDGTKVKDIKNPLDYDYVHNAKTGKVVNIDMNSNIHTDKIDVTELPNELPIAVTQKPAVNKKAIKNFLKLDRGNINATNKNTKEKVIINSTTIEKSMSNKSVNNVNYKDFCNILCNIKPLFETSQKILSHKDIKLNSSIELNRYANVAKIGDNSYLIELVTKDNGEITLYSVNTIDNKKVLSPNVSENKSSTPNNTNNSISYIQDLFKSKLVKEHNKDYRNATKTSETDKGVELYRPDLPEPIKEYEKQKNNIELKDFDLNPIKEAIMKGVKGNDLANLLPKKVADYVLNSVGDFKFIPTDTDYDYAAGVMNANNKTISLNIKGIGNSPRKFVTTLVHEVRHYLQEIRYNEIESKKKRGETLSQDDKDFVRKYLNCQKANAELDKIYKSNPKLINKFLSVMNTAKESEFLANLKDNDYNTVENYWNALDEQAKDDLEIDAEDIGVEYGREYTEKSKYEEAERIPSGKIRLGEWLGRAISQYLNRRNTRKRVERTGQQSGISKHDTGSQTPENIKIENKVKDEVYKWHGEIGKNRYDVDKTLNSFVNISKGIAKKLDKKITLGGVKDWVTDKDVREILPFLRERTEVPAQFKRLRSIYDKLSKEDIKELTALADNVSKKFEKYYKEYQEAKGVMNPELIENHISHLWKEKDKHKKSLLTNYITTNSRFAKKRTIGTLIEGINGINIDGEIVKYKPRTLDYAEILKETSDNLIKATADSKFANIAKNLESNKQKLVLPASKAPADWVEINHPALNKAVYMGAVGENELPMLMKTPVKVHPAAAKYLNAVFEVQKPDNAAWKAYDVANGLIKQATLGFSGFHGWALSESDAGNRGVINTLKQVLNFKNYYNAVKNNEYEIYKKEEIVKQAIEDGLQLGTPQLDTNRKIVEKAISSIPVVGDILGGAIKANNKILWDVLHNNYKIMAYENAIKDLGENPTKEQRRAVAQWVNDSFGGQAWELLGVKKSTVKAASRLLLSPDWNFSAIRQTFGAFNNKTLDNFLSKQDSKFWKDIRNVAEAMGVSEAPEAKTARGRKARAFWLRYLLYAYILSNGLNAAFREKDRKEHPELYPEKMSPFDYSVWANTMPNENMYEKIMPTIFIGRNKDGRARYLRLFKQAREVPEFVTKPVEKISGKSSALINVLSQTLLGYSPADIPKSLMGNKKDIYYNQNIWNGFGEYAEKKKGGDLAIGMARAAGKSVMPFIAQTALDDKHELSAWDFVAQTSKGGGFRKTEKQMEESFEKGNIKDIKTIASRAKRDGLATADVNNAISKAEKEFKSKYAKQFEYALEYNNPQNIDSIKQKLKGKGYKDEYINNIYKQAKDKFEKKFIDKYALAYEKESQPEMNKATDFLQKHNHKGEYIKKLQNEGHKKYINRQTKNRRKHIKRSK